MDKTPVTVHSQFLNNFSNQAEINRSDLIMSLIIGIIDYIITYNLPKVPNQVRLRNSSYFQELSELYQIYSNPENLDKSLLKQASLQLSQKINLEITSSVSNQKVYDQKVFIKIAYLFSVSFSVLSNQSLNVYGIKSPQFFTLYLVSSGQKYYLLFPNIYSNSIDLSYNRNMTSKKIVHCGDSYSSFQVPAGQQQFYKNQLKNCFNCKEELFDVEKNNLYKIFKIDRQCFECDKKFKRTCLGCNLEFCDSHKNQKCGICIGIKKNISKVLNYDSNIVIESTSIVPKVNTNKIIPVQMVDKPMKPTETSSVSIDFIDDTEDFHLYKNENFIIINDNLLNQLTSLTFRFWTNQKIEVKQPMANDANTLMLLMQDNYATISQNRNFDNIKNLSQIKGLINHRTFCQLFFLNLKLEIFIGSSKLIFGNSIITKVSLCIFNTFAKKMMIQIDDPEMKNIVNNQNNEKIKELKGKFSIRYQGKSESRLIYSCCGCKMEYFDYFNQAYLDFEEKTKIPCQIHKKSMNEIEKKIISSFYTNFHKGCFKCCIEESQFIICKHCSAKYCRFECSDKQNAFFSIDGDNIVCIVCKKLIKHPDLSKKIENKIVEISAEPSTLILYHFSHYSKNSEVICIACGDIKYPHFSEQKCQICKIFQPYLDDLCKICLSLKKKLRN